MNPLEAPRHGPEVIDPEFRRRPARYLGQVLIATIFLAVILICQDVLANAAIVTAVAASTFLLFINPSGVMAQPRHVVGGHTVAVCVACLFSFLLYDSGLLDWAQTGVPRNVVAALAVGTAILAMAVTNTEHAPAAGTVLGLVLTPWSLKTSLALCIAVLALTLGQRLIRRRLIDLL